MAAGIIVIPSLFPARDRFGWLVPGAKLGVYVNQTTTKAAIFSDEALTTPLDNPVVANSSGQFPLIWTNAGTTEAPVLYTVSISGPDGQSIANPSVFHDWQPSLDADTAAAAIATAAAEGAEASYQNVLTAIQAAQDADGDAALAGAIAGQAAGETAGAQAASLVLSTKTDKAALGESLVAAGDGVTNDRAALIAASDAAGAVLIRAEDIYYFGNTSDAPNDPAFSAYGLGSLKWSGNTLTGYRVDYDVQHESIWSTPDSWFKATRAGASVSPEYPPYAPPGRGDLTNIFNTVVSQRSGLRRASLCQNVSAFGANIGVRAHEWTLTDAFGADAMMFAYLSDRNTALGTETMVWLGAPDRQYLIDTNHDFYRNTPPDQWTAGNNELEALFPGIGLRIYNYANYATDRSQVTANTATGRDAMCHLVRGVNNVASGYQSAVMLWEGSDNVAYGALSMRNMVFGSNNTVYGNRALQNANDTNQATGVGYGAMRSAKAASNAVGVGYLCGDGVENTVGAVLLGTRAGAGYSGSLQNKWVVGNSDVATRNPAASGDFTTGRMGVNIPIGTERSNLHVRVGAGSGSAQAQEAGLLVEGPGLVALSLEGPAGATTGVNFGVAGAAAAGRIEYAGGSNQMLFKTNGAFKARLLSDGTLRPETDNAQPLGAAAQRWSVVYAGTGTINTSDARQKTDVRSLTAAEVAAASDLAREIGGYRFLSAVAEKGEDARTHIGMTVQRAIAIMQGHGLDPLAYGFICHDAWEAWSDPALYDVVEDRGEDGELLETRQVLVREEVHQPAGDVYSFRPDEFLMFMAKGFDARLSALEAAMG